MDFNPRMKLAARQNTIRERESVCVWQTSVYFIDTENIQPVSKRPETRERQNQGDSKHPLSIPIRFPRTLMIRAEPKSNLPRIKHLLSPKPIGISPPHSHCPPDPCLPINLHRLVWYLGFPDSAPRLLLLGSRHSKPDPQAPQRRLPQPSRVQQ